MPSTLNPAYHPGLEGIAAAQTRLSQVDGTRGQLMLVGYAIEALALGYSFEDVVYLLWFGTLPEPPQRDAFSRELADHRRLPQATIALLRAAAAADTQPMDAVQMAVASLSLKHEASATTEPYVLVAGLSTIVAAYWRLCQGQEPIQPRPELGHAANFLFMLRGTMPNDTEVRGLERYLITICDHGLNASTFAARVIISTRSDMISAMVGALGALKGPLHGGAPGPALEMVFEIGRAERAEAYVRERLDRGERLMGFGHRVYKTRDPRADVLAHAVRDLSATGAHRQLFELALAVEQTELDLLAEYKPGRQLHTNVEFYTALLLHGLGLEPEWFTPVFAMGRVAGWTAHAMEQRETDRLIRPRAIYIGPELRPLP